MAAIAPLRGFLPNLSLFALHARATWSFLRYGSVLPVPLAIPSIHSLLDLLPPFLLAVPKKKVSHSRKAMRSSGKGLKDKTRSCNFSVSLEHCPQQGFLDIVHCPACGSPKLAHHVCASCYSEISRTYKREAREALSARDVE